MHTRPTTEQVLRGIAADLAERVLPDVASEHIKVEVQIMVQLLNSCATRAAHEIAWMDEEAAAIEAAIAPIDDPATVAALDAYRRADRSQHLDLAAARYHLAGEALAAGVEHAYVIGDDELARSLRELLKVRSSHEMAIVGALDLVGRG